MKKLAVLLVYLGLCLAAACAQTPQTRMQGGNMPPGENVVGKVTAVAADSVTIAPITGGDPVTVKVNDNTRILKERQPAKLSDVKVDETIAARGSLNGKTMDAMVLFVLNPEMLQRMQQFGQGMGSGQGAFNREDLGKKFIAGEVKVINETKLTIARPDNQSQDIEVDENTSFKKGSESVTLADIKVGDFVFGPGEVKDGAFVPKLLNVGRPRMMIGGPGAQGTAADQKKPEAEKPAPPKQ